MRLKISEFKIKIRENIDIALLHNKLAEHLRIEKNEINNILIDKKSLDARKKPDLYFVFSLIFDVKNKKLAERLIRNNKLKLSEYKNVKYKFPFEANFFNNIIDRPVIVGFGPAGFICAYELAKAGLKPIVIERGDCVEKRIQKVQDFWDGKGLDLNTNIQFGEGGAGTFSDGKLQTGVKDKTGRIKYILEILVENGAPENILYDSKPHIGTDVLTEVVRNIRNEIINLGGEIRFNTRFLRCLHNNFMLTELVIENDDGQIENIKCNNLILCIGHSSRDTFYSLYDSGVEMTSKPFAVGFRALHLQKTIDVSRYGNEYPDFLPASDYKVTYQASSGRGVYSFCMCPGGYVVNASSENNMTVVNGMSYSRRDSKYANSAIVITVDKDLFGNDVFSGLEFQRKLESNAYNVGNGAIPVESLDDFRNNKAKDFATNDTLCIKGEYVFADITGILPRDLNNDIVEAFDNYGRYIKDFDKDVFLAGVETRTSSPIKILRNDDFQSNIKGLYPCGEGAGYAGGITSAALDGLKVAESVAMHYNSTLEIS